MTARNGSHALGRPGGAAVTGPASAGWVVTLMPWIPRSDPVGALAGFESTSTLPSLPEPVGSSPPKRSKPGNPSKVAGFEPSDPGGALAGFGATCKDWIAFATDPRSTFSRRAISRCD